MNLKVLVILTELLTSTSMRDSAGNILHGILFVLIMEKMKLYISCFQIVNSGWMNIGWMDSDLTGLPACFILIMAYLKILLITECISMACRMKMQLHI